jgi:F-type H+-transporting ATPase subunit delta
MVFRAVLHRSIGDATRASLRDCDRDVATCRSDKSELGNGARVETSGGIQANLAGRYAAALFGLARERKAIDRVEKSLSTLAQALTQSKDLQRLVTSPLIQRGAAANAVNAVGTKLMLDPLTQNFFGVLATNRRLNQLAPTISAFRIMAASFRGEASAEVTSAHPLTPAQMTALRAKLKTRMGRDVAIAATVNPAILGGLVVKIGSQMIDSSIRTKLNSLAVAMKG